MLGQAARVTITEEQKKILEALVSSPSTPRRLAHRTQFILLTFSRKLGQQIAQRGGIGSASSGAVAPVLAEFMKGDSLYPSTGALGIPLFGAPEGHGRSWSPSVRDAGPGHGTGRSRCLRKKRERCSRFLPDRVSKVYFNRTFARPFKRTHTGRPTPTFWFARSLGARDGLPAGGVINLVPHGATIPTCSTR